MFTCVFFGLPKFCLGCSVRKRPTTLPLVFSPNIAEKRVLKFHTDDASLPRSGCFWLVVPHGKFDSTHQKHYPDLGSDASSVWIEFPCSFLRCHLAGKPVVMSTPIVGRFLRLVWVGFSWPYHSKKVDLWWILLCLLNSGYKFMYY